MYRESPEQPGDSGWTFMAGDESRAYTDDAANWAYYDVNTIANYDPEIVAFLDQPPGIALERNARGEFKRTPVRIEQQCRAGLRLYGPPGILVQLLTNLMQNCRIHAFADGTRPGTIRIDVEDGNIEMYDIKVTFGNGAPFSPGGDSRSDRCIASPSPILRRLWVVTSPSGITLPPRVRNVPGSPGGFSGGR